MEGRAGRRGERARGSHRRPHTHTPHPTPPHSYGAVPLVRRTGGLADTVFADGPRANGFVFDGADEAAVTACVDGAMDVWWTQRDRFEAVRRAGMEADVSWDGSAGAYVDAYGGVGEE